MIAVTLASYTREEWLIILLARQIRDGEVVGVGNNSPIPAAAALLARSIHAKLATVYILGQRDWPFQGTKEFFDLMQRGGIDLFFLSGAQIDPYGNINLHVIGDYGKPKVRLPGGAGSGVAYFTCKRIVLFKTDHAVKGFPERLDFVTSAASSSPEVFRRSELVGVFTPYGVLKPATGADHRLELAETAPGVSPMDVQARTGFDLGIGADPETIPASASPTDDELNLLRTFVREELRTVYPKFAEESLGTR